MAPKKTKKPTQAELLQQLIAQVAELRGRVERVESRNSRPVVVEKCPPPPANWWSWLIGG